MSLQRSSRLHYYCWRLVAMLLTIATSLFDCEASNHLTCYRWESKTPRDCTCGRLRYDIEDQCQDELTYYEQRFRHIQTSSCPFVCENGGTFFQTSEGAQGCNCKEGYHGACCEIGKPDIYSSQIAQISCIKLHAVMMCSVRKHVHEYNIACSPSPTSKWSTIPQNHSAL